MEHIGRPLLPQFPHLTIIEQDGLRTLHFGTKWVQGAMLIENPYSLELEYVQQMMSWMLFKPQPAHIVQLGLGAGSLTKSSYALFPEAQVTAVELDPGVVAICKAAFALPPEDERLRVVVMDAMTFITDPANRGMVDILQVDLYDSQALTPVLGSPEFYYACAECLSPDGIMTVNLFCDAADHALNLRGMDQAFAAVAWMPEVHDGNVVAIAFKQAPVVDFTELYQRAAAISESTSLPAETWVDGLIQWMGPR